MNIINAMNIVPATAINEIAAQRAAVEAAKKALRDAKNKAIQEIANSLRQNRGMTILRSDVVAQTGLCKKDLDRLEIEYGAYAIYTRVTRRFAEVDEQGQLIPNGRTRTTSRKMAGYYME